MGVTWRVNGPRAWRGEQAVRALADGVDPCPHCWPDTDLGMLD
ncbi:MULTISPECIES: DUF6233 domain-containing protein [unclassified Streptomyces]